VIAMPRTLPGRGTDNAGEVSCLDEAVWSLMQEDSSCLYRYDFSANAFPHRPHTCGLVWECVCTCARRLDLSAKAFVQMEHLNGFSPGKWGLISDFVSVIIIHV
jgi:hypothetical protein